KVGGLGIDTLSVDYGPSGDFKVHYTTQPNGMYHIENMANLDQLPAKGATLIVSPLKLKDGSGSPARIWAIVPLSATWNFDPFAKALLTTFIDQARLRYNCL